VALSSYVLNVNLILAFFNLLPLPPFDGFMAAVSLLNLVRDASNGVEGGSPSRAAAGSRDREASALSPARLSFLPSGWNITNRASWTSDRPLPAGHRPRPALFPCLL